MALIERLWPYAAAVLVFLAVAGGGYYVRAVKAERDSLRVTVSTQKDTINAQALQKERDDLTLKSAQKAAQEASSQAAEARTALSRASPVWRATALPKDIQEALK